MTVAQFVHPIRGLASPQGGISFRSLRQTLFGHWSPDAVMWREIATGLLLAVAGLVMMAVALGAAGPASAPADTHGDAAAVVQAAPARHSAIYQNPAEALTEAMPVP